MASQNTDVVDDTNTAFRDCELLAFMAKHYLEKQKSPRFLVSMEPA